MKPHSLSCRAAFVLAITLGIVAGSNGFAQGNLMPPGAPAPSMKTLAQIEPRTPISVLPYDITNSGSYYFTTNLSGDFGIFIYVNNVTIDLNGFSLSGTTGETFGINNEGALTNICVKNGMVNGWSFGVHLKGSVNSVISDIHAAQNTSVGIYIGRNGIIKNCLAEENESRGIAAGDGSIITACVARNNGSIGIEGQRNVSVIGCSTSSNATPGIQLDMGGSIKDSVTFGNEVGMLTGKGSTVAHCTATANSGFGIDLGEGSTAMACTVRTNKAGGMNVAARSLVKDCVASQNIGKGFTLAEESILSGSIASQNSNDGISTAARCQIIGCSTTQNGDDGIQMSEDSLVMNNVSAENRGSGSWGINVSGSNSRVDGNHVRHNTQYGIIVAGGTNNVIVRNTSSRNGAANLDSANYNVSGANDLGPIGNASINTSPWANLR